MSTTVVINLPVCKGCGGRGLDSIFKGAQLCPICLGTGFEPMANQQTMTRLG